MILVVVGCDAGCGRVSLPMPDVPGARARARLDGWWCDPTTSTHWCPKHSDGSQPADALAAEESSRLDAAAEKPTAEDAV